MREPAKKSGRLDLEMPGATVDIGSRIHWKNWQIPQDVCPSYADIVSDSYAAITAAAYATMSLLREASPPVDLEEWIPLEFPEEEETLSQKEVLVQQVTQCVNSCWASEEAEMQEKKISPSPPRTVSANCAGGLP